MGKTLMDVRDFGAALLDANDLDPVYVILFHSGWNQKIVEKWLLAYWCCYHVGTASWIASHDTEGRYWEAMRAMAGSKDYPRSPERRHFRGDNARLSVRYLEERGIADLWQEIRRAQYEGKSVDADELMAIVGEWTGFGPWIAFKAADMLERLGFLRVHFGHADVLYDSPQKAADLVWSMHGEPHGGMGRTGAWAIDLLLNSDALAGRLAPPREERALGLQEAETILCKWGSYIKGHYEIGEDVESCRKGLLRFARCRLTQDLLRAGREGELW